MYNFKLRRINKYVDKEITSKKRYVCNSKINTCNSMIDKLFLDFFFRQLVLLKRVKFEIK